MITYSNIQRFDKVEFREYLKTPGYSYSFLKGEQFGIEREVPNSDKIMLGKLVDAILTEPEKADMLSPFYKMARDIAASIRKEFPYIQHFEKQVSFSGVAEHRGFKMEVRGRLDYFFRKVAVVDLKITAEKDIDSLIKWMGYENQLWNYAKLGEVDKAYLFIYSVPLKKTFVRPFDCSVKMNSFWAEKILNFGTV